MGREMNARRLILAVLASLCSLAVVALPAAPVALAEELCPNVAARQGPSSALPDCRAYEQVTPVSKADSSDIFGSSREIEETGSRNEGVYVSEDGDHVLFHTEGSFEGGNSNLSSYVFSRGAKGWTTTSLSPGPGVHALQPRVFNPENLSVVGFEDDVFSHPLGQPKVAATYSLAGNPGGPYTTLAMGPEGASQMMGASADLSHVVLESSTQGVLPAPAGLNEGAPALDEWSDGRLRAIDVATDGTLISPCGAVFGGGETGEGLDDNPTAISSDGSKILFTAPGPGSSCWQEPSENNPPETEVDPPQLYMRINAAVTVEVSAPNRGVSDPTGPQAAYFVGASADDSKVFFMSRAQLTADDPGHAPELYEYDIEAPEGERLVRVSGGESGTAEGHVHYVPAISSDGSMVYFAAFDKLAQGAATYPAKTEGPANLYVFNTKTKRTTFISETSGYPLQTYTPSLQPETGGWGATLFGYGPPENAIARDPNANWATTANGQYLLFASTLPLTGYDNLGTDTTSYLGQVVTYQNFPFEELFRYSVAENTLVCVSCVVGAPPTIDNATFDRGDKGIALPDAGPPHAISEDGSYVFFETMNALLPQAIPGRLHVYEWHEGKISLISSPGDPSGAFFLGASPDGSNVFFGTHAQLVAQDTDAGGDIYDARIDGGFASIVPSQCTGTGCQGIPGAPPIFATPASVTFEGVGNFPAGTVAPTGPTTVKPKSSSGRARKLAKALRACRRDRSKHRRVRCEAGTRARYGKAAEANKSTKAGRGN